MSTTNSTMENVSDFDDESLHSSWAKFQVEFGNLQEHKIRVFNTAQKLKGSFWK